MPSVGGLSAMSAVRTFEAHQRAVARTMERLATGKQINRAADDPAGMAAATSLGARRATLEEVIGKSEQNQFLLSAVDGGLAAVGDLLLELNGLVTTAANKGGLSDAEKEGLQTEAESILQAIDHVLNTTTFGGRKVLAETMLLETGDTVHVLPALSLASLGLGRSTAPTPPAEGPPAAPARPAIDLASGNLEAIQKKVRGAVDQVAGVRARVGALAKFALGPAADLARTELENTLAAESKIVDADLAAETAELARSQTLAQASLAVIQIAQNQAQSVLNLIRV